MHYAMTDSALFCRITRKERSANMTIPVPGKVPHKHEHKRSQIAFEKQEAGDWPCPEKIIGDGVTPT